MGKWQARESLLQHYMQLLLQLLQHPSQKVTYTCLPVWHQVLKSAKAKRHLSWFPQLLPPLLDTLAGKLKRVGHPYGPDDDNDNDGVGRVG